MSVVKQGLVILVIVAIFIAMPATLVQASTHQSVDSDGASLPAQQGGSVEALFTEWGLTPAQVDQFIATFDDISSVQALQEAVDFGDISIAELREFLTEDFGPPPAGGAAQPPPAGAGDGSFTPAQCPFAVPPDQQVDCGVLSVPENRSQPNGQSVTLAVAIFRSYSPNPLPDSIIYLEGGPGGSALAAPDAWYQTPLRNDRDIIVFDQRGTGYSIPNLNCPEFDDDDSLQAVTNCRNRLLGEGVDLGAYNSRENAADVEALRLALGLDQVNLYGISYGTRLGLTVMRDHPGGLRSVVLDSVYPPNVDSNYLSVPDTFRLANAMFADCAADSACSAAFPDLQNRFYGALDQFASQPIQVTDPNSGEVVDFFVEDILNTLFSQLQGTALVSAIPASLNALLNGDYDAYMVLATQGAGDGPTGPLTPDVALVEVEFIVEELEQDAPDILQELEAAARNGDSAFIVQDFVDGYGMSQEDANIFADAFIQYVNGARADDGGDGGGGPEIDDDSEGMNMSVQCYEEMPFMDVDVGYDLSLNSGAPQIFVDAIYPGFEFDQCDIWQPGVADAIENQAVVSDIPALVLAGIYDTATPPEWSALSAQTLSNSFYYLFPNVGHGVLDGGECPVTIITSFLANPAQQPNAACVDGLRPSFYTGDGSELLGE